MNNNKSIKPNPLIDLVKRLQSLNQRFSVLACIIFYSLFITASPALAADLVTNTATANFSINGNVHQVSDSVQFTKDAVIAPSDIITLEKSSDVNISHIGKTIVYTLKVSNPTDHTQNNVRILDILPPNLSYQLGSTKLNGASTSANQVIINANQVSINLGNIPANTTWLITYEATILSIGTAINKATVKTDSATSTQASYSLNVVARTPSTIKFLKISDAGVDAIIPPTSFNNDQNGGKQWEPVDTITLADGTSVTLPTPQPIIDASHYRLLDPIIIEVSDLDQNLNSTQIDTIIVEVTVPGTNDKEVLLLQETSPNSGVFRGVLLTTSESASTQDGLLSLVDGSTINVNYRDEEDSTDISAKAALVVPNTTLLLTKTADKKSTSIGEIVKYTLTFTNNTNSNIANIKVFDTLPLGFKFIPNSAKLNGNLLNSGISSTGRNLIFNFDNMLVEKTWTLEYLTKVTAGAQIGHAVNTAYIDSGTTQSAKAHATVLINDDLMRSKNILTGRVYIGCNTEKDAKMLKDARIFMETGRSVLTDKEGFWHMEGVQAGTHVLQLDKISLPSGYKPLLCEGNTRFANNPASQFVNLQAGSLWQVNFYVEKDDTITATESPVSDGNVDNVVTKEKNPFDLFGKEYLQAAASDFEILWPKNNYVPTVASTKIFIKSSPKYKVEVLLNGKKVNPLNYDGSETNKARTVTIRRWKGVDINIKNRNNSLVAILKDKSGKEIARKTHNIHFSGDAVSAKFIANKSKLIADGKTIPVITLLPKDKDGFRLRTGSHGYFSLKNNQFQVKTLSSTADTLNLNESLSGSYKYHVDADGFARIQLNPTTQSGEVELNLTFSDGKKQVIKAWLKPQLREWILVGLAEGTLAHNTLSGNMTSLSDLDKVDGFSKQGRVSFYAQGKVKGKYLLTVAYDTHKEKQKIGSQLNGNIDPDAWYTIYGDNSNSQYNAPSSRKLYLKIEKENFYALFGDYNTGMNITELAKYERVLNGIKTEYKGDRFSYSAFISETSNKHQHEEIAGDGTSGLYHLSFDIVTNSEKIKLETRDRFHSERIIDSRVLTRYQDYEIDYTTGALFFKFPITGRDANFNPQFIVIDYDSINDDNKELVLGGRVSTKMKDDTLEVGISSIMVNRDNTKNDSLIAVDANYKITKDTTLHIEVAQSKTAASNFATSNAEIIALEKEIADMEARLFYRKQDKNFGIINQASENDTQKMGGEIRYKINDKTRLNAEISQEKNLDNGNKRDLAEISLKQRHKQLEMSAGIRHSKEELANTTVTNDMLLVGARYTTKNGRVTYRANIEENINSSGISERSPNRRVLGVDLKINNGMGLFAEHEQTTNNSVKTENFRVGVNKSLWTGAKARSTYTKERTDQGQRDYATLGLSQTIQISKYLKADISVDHAKTISSTQQRFNSDEAELQGSLQSDDYTAFSVGIGSQIKDWSWSGRFELRDGELSDKLNLQVGLIHHLKNGKQVSAKFSSTETDFSDGKFERNTNLSIGTAWHPTEKSFAFFSRLDLIDERKTDTVANSNNHTQKIVHNMHYNRKFNNKKTQISIHHGIKHIIDKNSAERTSATIDTATVQLRHDINKKWDIGAKIGYLHDWTEDTSSTVAGVSIGMTPAKNAWVELGYNVEGFNDADFDDNNYKQKGIYIGFSYKFDQNSLKSKAMKEEEGEIKEEEDKQTKGEGEGE